MRYCKIEKVNPIKFIKHLVLEDYIILCTGKVKIFRYKNEWRQKLKAYGTPQVFGLHGIPVNVNTVVASSFQMWCRVGLVKSGKREDVGTCQY